MKVRDQRDRRVIEQLGVERKILAIVVERPDILKIALMLREDRRTVLHQAKRRLQFAAHRQQARAQPQSPLAA